MHLFLRERCNPRATPAPASSARNAVHASATEAALRSETSSVTSSEPSNMVAACASFAAWVLDCSDAAHNPQASAIQGSAAIFALQTLRQNFDLRSWSTSYCSDQRMSMRTLLSQ